MLRQSSRFDHSVLSPQNKRGASWQTPLAPLVPTRLPDYLQPEQEAQQSAEPQHEELARTAPARPSATTAPNTIALILFIEFSPLRTKGLLSGR
jgi:hypothetical protein